MARKFETEYRVGKTAEILAKENAFRLDVDLRLDAIERGLAAIGSTADVLTGRVVHVIDQEIAPRAAEIDALLTSYREGIPAASVHEEIDGREFMTPARRAAIVDDFRADIAAAISDLKAGVDPAYDTLIEIAAKLSADDSAIGGIVTALANRLRIDTAAQGLDATQQGNARTNLGLGSAAVRAESHFLRNGTSSNITTGFTFSPANLGSLTSFALDPSLGNYQYGTNNGAFTLTAPSSDCAVDLLITNGASAGAITFSGFTVGSVTGDALTTTNGSKFIVSIRRINAVSTYTIKALQ